MAKEVVICPVFSEKQAEAALLAMKHCQAIWNDRELDIVNLSSYSERLALDEAIEELKEAMK